MKSSPKTFRLGAILLLVGSIRAGVPIAASDALPSFSGCTGPEYHQFDFWIGEWKIKQKILQENGDWFEADATTKVSPILGGCALMEEWQGNVLFFWEGMNEPELIKGFSVRAYDPRRQQWVISWMDSRHLRFTEFTGAFKEKRGEFFRKQSAESGKETTTRITFAEIAPDAVRWELAVRSNDSENWKILWIMDMTRKR